jgi:phage terminase small subunit
MLALPNDRYRDFVVALFTVKSGHGAATRAARAAGFGSDTSSARSMANIASRLMHNEAVIDAMREYGEQFLRAAGPTALRALEKLVLTPSHKGHERAVAAVVDRLYPVETVSTLNVRHDATPTFKSTAEIMERIAVLTAKFNLGQAPIVIEAKAEEVRRDG